MDKDKAKQQIAPALILGVALLPQAVLALDGAAYFGAATEYTSNSLQEATNEQSDTSYIGLGGVDLTHVAGDFDVQANYGIEKSTYQNDTQSDETSVNGAGEAHWRIRPDTLTWDLRHSSARTKGLQSGVDTADTRTTQKIFSTGPRSLLHLSPQDSLSLGAQWMQVSTSGETSNKSDRELYDLSLQHATSQIQSFGISASRQNADFDADTEPSLTFTQASLDWNRDHRLGGMRLSVGKNRSQREGFDTFDGDLLRAYIDFNSVGHTVSFAAVNELTDSLLGLNNTAIAVNPPSTDPNQPDGFNPESTNLDVVDALESTRFEVNYSTARLCARCSPSVRVSWDEQDYLTQLLDQKVFTVTAAMGYRLTERLSTSLSVSRSRQEYLDEQSRTDVVWSENLGMNYRLWPDLVIEGYVAQQNRDSDAGEAEYDELMARVGFRYYFANF